MTDRRSRQSGELGLFQLLPNMLTITAICAGITAIRFGVNGQYLLAVQLILLAAVLDGIDGRLARLLGSDSKMGAELDSLADFLNFGVVPPLILYYWALYDMRGAGWIVVLFFSVCCVVRLARFNVTAKEATTSDSAAYFVGVPAPAGAILAMLPMFVSFAFQNQPVLPDLVIAAHLVVVGFLMISRIPTWSFKKTRISRDNVKFFLAGFAVVGAALLIYAWTTLVVLCMAYAGTVVWALITDRRKRKSSE